ncbi:MAG: hypothetical protein ACTSR3_04270 [Candidatus Helarchaeota archaeon]
MFKTKTQEDVDVVNEIISDLAQRFLDTINIRQILIFHRITGTTLVAHSYVEQETDPDLISGFITAISAFEKELVGLAGGLEELKYKFIRIMVDIGELTTASLIVNGDYMPTPRLRKNFKEFRERFELEFQTELEKFDGYVKPFRNISHLLEDHFEVSLLGPHRFISKKYFTNLRQIFELPNDKLNQIRKMTGKHAIETLGKIIKKAIL